MDRRKLIAATATAGTMLITGCNIYKDKNSSMSNLTVGRILIYNDSSEEKTVSIFVLRDGDVDSWSQYTLGADDSTDTGENTSDSTSNTSEEDTVIINQSLSGKPGIYKIGVHIVEDGWETFLVNDSITASQSTNCQQIAVLIDTGGEIRFLFSDFEDCTIKTDTE